MAPILLPVIIEETGLHISDVSWLIPFFIVFALVFPVVFIRRFFALFVKNKNDSDLEVNK